MRASTSSEIWRPISGFPHHEVSNLGRVRSLPRKGTRGGLLRQLPAHRRSKLIQMSVRLWRGGKIVDRSVHSLVLKTFVGEAPPGLVGCHDDGDAAHNHLGNLRWDTRSANADDSKRHQTFALGERHGLAKLTLDDVRCILAEPAAPGVVRMMGRKFGVSHSRISEIRTGRTWSAAIAELAA